MIGGSNYLFVGYWKEWLRTARGPGIFYYLGQLKYSGIYAENTFYDKAPS